MGVTNPTILAFDTSAAHCAAAILQRDAIVAERIALMGRGQAEHLMPMLEALLSEVALGWKDLHYLAVGIGPGNFTGTRISVAAARGLALALRIPAIGVSSFEVMRDPAGPGAHPAEIVSIEAPRGAAYVQRFGHGRPQSAPRLIAPDAPPEDLRLPVNMRVRGYRADDIARPFGAEASDAVLEDIACRIARIADWRLSQGEKPDRPAPLYVRPADAAPPSEAPPVILPG
ncbi:tRNA threonylcarbamoyladenosine biosynthesis protein TsaB [Defluviimonas aquaemixtae]|uniref:tRNA threonylcarbamoyladenosine biosynthesis protein TsaB n=1 Tax=Albidovulum aquaemixtae TaxID=1542388 RepID=A0A2R8BMC9_9RHOB|nr:tRNA (adenosine(37)-N6)-threonylcarbamoyltransferase complex dimerization subunit type 1 TsaB [Defluviimonas aquaemixtae]SPH24575.1 tRNA threonylcarbamoyladenosine biosynthesis protein TsaB [Defluviimonas aquaemixtae]